MGKSGYLPDISSSFSFYRAFAINSIQNKDWRGAVSALYNINSLLTEDYVITIDSDEYEKEIKESYALECPYCQQTTQKKDAPIWNKALSSIDSIVLQQDNMMCWHCLHCGEDPPIDGTTLLHEKAVQPFYRKVVPEPPKQVPGLLMRFTWVPEFKRWFYHFLEQLTHQLALYRIEYISQHGEDMQDPMFKDEGNKE